MWPDSVFAWGPGGRIASGDRLYAKGMLYDAARCPTAVRFAGEGFILADATAEELFALNR